MENKDQDVKKEQDETLAHVENEKKNKEPETYDPDKYLPTSQGTERYEPEVPLEDKKPNEGYSTNPAQGKESASLHLADEDMDIRQEDPIKEAENLKESYQKSQESSK